MSRSDVSIPVTVAGTTSQVAFNQFDGALGALKGVTLSFAADSSTTFSFANNTGSQRTWTITRQGAASLSGYGLTVSDTYSEPQAVYTLAARLSPSNPRTGTATYTGEYAASGSLTSGLSAFVGGGTLSFLFAPLESFSASGSGGGSANESPTQVSGQATLTYEYEEAVGGIPEPSTWLMMIGGFGLVGVVLRRRHVRATA